MASSHGLKNKIGSQHDRVQATHPHPLRQIQDQTPCIKPSQGEEGKEMTGTAIKTNGIGQRTTAHLNLTRTMADAPALSAVQPNQRRRWDRDVWANQKIQFAGKDK